MTEHIAIQLESLFTPFMVKIHKELNSKIEELDPTGKHWPEFVSYFIYQVFNDIRAHGEMPEEFNEVLEQITGQMMMQSYCHFTGCTTEELIRQQSLSTSPENFNIIH